MDYSKLAGLLGVDRWHGLSVGDTLRVALAPTGSVDSHTLIITAGLVICLGVATFVLSERIGIPSIVLLLLVGVLAGPEVLGVIDPAHFGIGLQVLIPLLVAIIVFEGGMVLDIHDLRRISYPVQMLISVGALVTWAGATVVAHWVAGLSWPLAVLFGSIVSVTGPTVITPLMRRTNVRERLKVLLKAEGVLVDAVGAILAVVVLNVLLSSGTALGGAFAWLQRFGVGVLIGAVGGIALAYLLRLIGARISIETTRLSTLAGAIGIFVASEAIFPESGIAAAAISGIVVGNMDIPHEDDVIHFKGDLTILAITIIFVLLAAKLKFADLLALGWGGGVAVVLLIVIVRPLCVFLSTIGSTLSTKEKLFVSAVSPRGVVSASVATFAALQLETVGFEGGNLLIGLVFMTVIGTVVLQSFTTPWLARILGVEPMTTVIIGANPLGLALAQQLQTNGRDVTLIDTNDAHLQAARNAGLTVVSGDAREADVLRKAGIARAETVLALTESDSLNALIAQTARHQFNIRDVVARTESASAETVLREQQIRTMNPLNASVMILDTMVRRPSTLALLTDSTDGKTVRETPITNPRILGRALKSMTLSEDVLVAMVRRNGTLFVPHGSTVFQADDEVTLIGTPAGVNEAVLMFSETGMEQTLTKDIV